MISQNVEEIKGKGVTEFEGRILSTNVPDQANVMQCCTNEKARYLR